MSLQPLDTMISKLSFIFSFNLHAFFLFKQYPLQFLIPHLLSDRGARREANVYSRQQDGNVLLICSMTSVRSELVSCGGASRSSAAVTAQGKHRDLTHTNNAQWKLETFFKRDKRSFEISAQPSTKIQLQEQKPLLVIQEQQQTSFQ